MTDAETRTVLDEAATVVQLDAEVKLARSRAQRLTAWAIMIACLCVLSSLAALILVLHDKTTTAESNGRRIAELSQKLDEINAESTQRDKCQQRFATASSFAFAEYEVALGDLVTALVSTSLDQQADRAVIIRARVDALKAALILYREAVDARQQWDSAGATLPCPLQPKETPP